LLKFIFIFKKISKIKKKKLFILETGCGSSTIALVLHCALFGGKVYSWDINPTKGSLIRTVLFETIGRSLNVDINKIWTFIGTSSTNPYTGINILKELSIKIDYCFLDSAHNTEHLIKELDCIEAVSRKNFYVALDDAYTNQLKINLPYVNMVRTKIGLKKINDIRDNISSSFYEEVISFYLKKKYSIKKVKNPINKKKEQDDIYLDYYKSDYNFMKKIGLVKKPQKRFVIFCINK
jgi:hypothetical protein